MQWKERQGVEKILHSTTLCLPFQKTILKLTGLTASLSTYCYLILLDFILFPMVVKLKETGITSLVNSFPQYEEECATLRESNSQGTYSL